MCRGCGGTCGTARARIASLRNGAVVRKKKAGLRVLVHKGEVIIPPWQVRRIRAKGYGRFIPKRILK